MKIKFLRTCRYETEGRNLGPLYEAGVEYDLSDGLAQRWLRRGVAEMAVAPPGVVQFKIDVLPPAEIDEAPAPKQTKPRLSLKG